MNVIEQLRISAAQTGASVVFPEGAEPRTINAAIQLSEEGIVHPILLGSADEIAQAASKQGKPLADGVEVLDPQTSELTAQFAEAFYEMRKEKGITPEEASGQVLNPLIFGAMMVRSGKASGCVAGAVSATSAVLRAGLQVIGMKPGVPIASSVFLMVLPDGRALTFGDCGMVPYPDANQLAAIAVASAQTHRQLTGEEPVVAMLSFSTKGSAEHESVTKVREACSLAQQLAPDLAIDGELQFDAAYLAAVGERKAPGSLVAGKANVFIFPNLDAGNIGYKITERLGGAQAIGPIVQGLREPMHDLSRGCKAEDIVTLAAICAVQALS